ncbi:peptidoglycan-binding protein [Saccharicrinis sp. FJH62]|uniref:peptidoglycan-binding domain-containing protein n=1 Tax=Saccharicrinis sp. FJH62 TaxID=3344657 RepID=UPI0035D48C4E
MSEGLPPYNHDALPDDPVDRLGAFEAILNDASKNGLVNDVPSNEEETYTLESQRIRLKTIASRLYLLGYLKRKVKAKQLHKHIDDIKEAVLWFQKDANLKQDNWVGNKTWSALDQLVSFESEIIPEQWFKDGKIREETRSAVHRAVQLRLWSLGLYRDKPRQKFNLLNQTSLKNFNQILHIFLIRAENYTANLDEETLNILFNQDLLTDTIIKRSSLKKNSFLLRLPDKNKEQSRSLAQSFIVNCAKIELWLLGYSVIIDGINNFAISTDSDIYEAIKKYYIDFEEMSVNEASDKAKNITPVLFKNMVNIDTDTDNRNISEVVQEIAEHLKTPSAIEEAWDYIKRKGTRLFDGLKRIWRWILKKGKQVVSFVKENIFVGFFRYASKAFKIIKKGFTVVINSVQTYVNGYLTSPNIVYKFSKDMDSTVIISSEITPEQTEASLLMINNYNRCFNLSCKIISLSLNIFISAVTGIAGWMRLLYSLLISYKDIRMIYEELKTVTI